MIDVADMPSVGTPRQHAYILSLAEQAGYTSLLEALQTSFGTTPAQLRERAFTVAEARGLIEKLKAQIAHRSEVAGTPERPRILTARHLRRMALREEEVPSPLDDDAEWILGRLQRLFVIERLALGSGQAVSGVAVNGHGPILTEQLLAYFETLEAVAIAFELSVQTVKGWGVNVPSKHAWRAEVLTQGYVRAPRT